MKLIKFVGTTLHKTNLMELHEQDGELFYVMDDEGDFIPTPSLDIFDNYQLSSIDNLPEFQEDFGVYYNHPKFASTGNSGRAARGR